MLEFTCWYNKTVPIEELNKNETAVFCISMCPVKANAIFQYWLDTSDHSFWGILSTFKKYSVQSKISELGS